MPTLHCEDGWLQQYDLRELQVQVLLVLPRALGPPPNQDNAHLPQMDKRVHHCDADNSDGTKLRSLFQQTFLNAAPTIPNELSDEWVFDRCSTAHQAETLALNCYIRRTFADGEVVCAVAVFCLLP
jgi:hypothetical protein